MYISQIKIGEMSSIQRFFARAGMKTVEQFEKLKIDAEKSLGIEAELEDPVLKEVQNIMVEEEDVLVQIKKMSNELIDSVSVSAKRDSAEMMDCLRVFVTNRGTQDQKYRIMAQLDEYRKIADETCKGDDCVANWLILELQNNVLNPIEKQLKRHEEMREKFWTIKELKRKILNLGKIADIDKKSKAEMLVAEKDCQILEQEVTGHLDAIKDSGIVNVDSIWTEFCRVEAEYYSRMNEAYLEPSTPSSNSDLAIGEASIIKHEKIASPVIGAEPDGESEVETLTN